MFKILKNIIKFFFNKSYYKEKINILGITRLIKSI